jgi:DNA transposition AAA+ family ATPase
MTAAKRNFRYPENRYLKIEVFKSEKEIGDIADEIGYSREAVSKTINGHYKGENIVPKLRKLLGLDESTPEPDTELN